MPNDDLEYNIVPSDNNTEIAEVSGQGQTASGKGLKGKVKEELVGYGISVAGTLLDNLARQGVALTGSVLKNLGERGKDIEDSVKGGIQEGGKLKDSIGETLKEQGKVFAQKMKDDLIEHTWQLADRVEEDISDDNRDFSQNVAGHIGDALGKDVTPIVNTAHNAWNDFASMEAARNMRKSMNSSDDVRDAGLTPPDDIDIYSDIYYGTDPVWNVMDIYRPKQKKQKTLKKLPVIVNFHGGAWIYGDKERYKFYCMSLAQRGFAVVNYSYRLAPEDKFPASLIDTNDVFIWLSGHHQEYGLDMDNMFMISDSAGANIAGLYVCAVSDPDYAANYDFTVPEGIHFNAAVFNCGAFDPLKFIGEKELMKGLVAGDTKYMQNGMMNVTDNMPDDFPPSFLMSCHGDFCMKFIKPMADALNEREIRNEVKIYGSEEAPLYHVFHLSVRDSLGKSVTDLECSFLREYIK